MDNHNVMFVYFIILWLGFLSLVVFFYRSTLSVLLLTIGAYLIVGLSCGIYLQKAKTLHLINHRLRFIVFIVNVLLVLSILLHVLRALFQRPSSSLNLLLAIVSLICLMTVFFWTFLRNRSRIK